MHKFSYFYMNIYDQPLSPPFLTEYHNIHSNTLALKVTNVYWLCCEMQKHLLRKQPLEFEFFGP